MSIERRLLQQTPRARTLLYRAVGLAFLAAAIWLVLAWLLSEVVSRVFLDHQTLSDVGGLIALKSGTRRPKLLAFCCWSARVTFRGLTARPIDRPHLGEIGAG